MITGRSASRSSAAARATSGTGPPAASGSGAGSAGSGASEKTTSIGKSMKVGPECGVTAAVSASSMSAGISAVASAVAASLVSGRMKGTWSSSCSEPWPQRIAGARPPSTSIGEPFCCAEAIALMPLVTPGPGGERRHARLAGDLGPALGGERGGRLVAHVDEVDALLAAAVEDREQMAARQREELGDAVRLQALGHQPAAVKLRGLLGLGAHRPLDPIDRCRAPCRSRLWDRRRRAHHEVMTTTVDLPAPNAPSGYLLPRSRRSGPRVRGLLPPARLPRGARRGVRRARPRSTRSSSPGCCTPELGLGLLQPRRVRVEHPPREAMVDHQHALAVGQLAARAPRRLSSAA